VFCRKQKQYTLQRYDSLQVNMQHDGLLTKFKLNRTVRTPLLLTLLVYQPYQRLLSFSAGVGLALILAPPFIFSSPSVYSQKLSTSEANAFAVMKS
jgi:hypothetical protein